MTQTIAAVKQDGVTMQTGSNQTPLLANYNLFASDPVLQRAFRYYTAQADDALQQIGAELGVALNFERARLANENKPRLCAFDARGERIDRIEFHPAWHELMSDITRRRLHNAPWALPGPAAHVSRAAVYLMQTQVESGTLCPVTMTYGAIPALMRDADLARDWLPSLLSDRYDARDVPIGDKTGGLIGMGMTEKQGGSDVRANTTQAVRCSDGSYRLTGHKWFYSAPQCDAHLVLAQAESGLSCFVVPRHTPDGQKNQVLIQRLKDKLGNRSNASAEVEFQGAFAQALGEPGRGIPTILEMGTFTRLDCVTGSAGLMRQMLVQALHHAEHRRVFGRALIEQPMMQQVLADLCLESAAASVLAVRLAHAFDRAASDPIELAYSRLVTPAAKFWICKRGPEFAAEAMEVLGGNGYVEEFSMARIYREMPVNSIWEGSGNIMCLDVLRALSRDASTRIAIDRELAPMRGRHRAYDIAFERLMQRLDANEWPQADGRHLAWQLVVMVQAAALLDGATPLLAEAFCNTRLTASRGAVFGSAEVSLPAAAIFASSWDHG